MKVMQSEHSGVTDEIVVRVNLVENTQGVVKEITLPARSITAVGHTGHDDQCVIFVGPSNKFAIKCSYEQFVRDVYGVKF